MKKYFLAVILLFNNNYAQIVYEPLHQDIYNFLSRLSQKGIIDFEDQLKPVARRYIAEKLLELNELKSQLNTVEKERA